MWGSGRGHAADARGMGRVRNQCARARAPRRRWVCRAVLVLTVMTLAMPAVATSAGAAPARENATFLYQPLKAQDLPSVGAPKLMVLTETASAAAAHAAGVRAFKYVQFNWFPTTG